MPPKVEFEEIDEHGSMVHSVISCRPSLPEKGCCDPSTIGDSTLFFKKLYFCPVQWCRTYCEKALRWSAASTSHCSTVFGSTSNTRATAQMPRPSAKAPTAHTRSSVGTRLPCNG